jgi:hypothetical protein
MYPRALFAIAAVLITSAFSAAQSSVIVSEEFTWQFQSVAQTTCNSYKHTLTGPGVLTIRTKMSPFRVRDLGMSSEDILTHGVGYFAESLGRTVNGMEGADTNEFIGKPIDRISRWKIDGNKHNVEFKVCNPVKCNLAGDCSQQQATASIVVDFAAAGSIPSTTGRTSSPANIVGTWIVIENGKVVDRIDIAPYGDGYKVEARAGDGAPTYWNGFGVQQSDRLIIATRNVSSGVSGLVVMTFKGDRVHYRSYYLDGRQAWDGDFTRRP